MKRFLNSIKAATLTAVHGVEVAVIGTGKGIGVATVATGKGVAKVTKVTGKGIANEYRSHKPVVTETTVVGPFEAYVAAHATTPVPAKASKVTKKTA